MFGTKSYKIYTHQTDPILIPDRSQTDPRAIPQIAKSQQTEHTLCLVPECPKVDTGAPKHVLAPPKHVPEGGSGHTKSCPAASKTSAATAASVWGLQKALATPKEGAGYPKEGPGVPERIDGVPK